MRNMTTIAEEKSRRENLATRNRNDKSNERRSSPIRRAKYRKRSPNFTPRTPGKRGKGKRRSGHRKEGE